MAKQFPSLDDTLCDFIRRQHMFFTASATAESRVNLSPRSMDAFRILDQNRVAYLDRTGSSNETAAHLLADGRLTIMFCSVDGPPQILRLYGKGRVLHRDSPAFVTCLDDHFPDYRPMAMRQIVELDVDLVQTSCGFGVPLFDYRAERPSLDRWAEKKEAENAVEDYWREKNLVSMDGLPTGLMD